MLQRAATWNGWSVQETLIQLAGHLRKRALLECNLLEENEKTSLSSVVVALREHLDPGSRSTAVQDFRYARQRESEPVGDFILRLGRIFRSAYGRDARSSETRSALLSGQLQLKAPAVSGAQKYSELCVAALNEEKRLAGLRRRQQLLRRQTTGPSNPRSGGQVWHRKGDETSRRDRLFVMLTPDAATDAIVLAISPETAGLQENGLVQGHPTRVEGHSPELVMFTLLALLPIPRTIQVGQSRFRVASWVPFWMTLSMKEYFASD